MVGGQQRTSDMPAAAANALAESCSNIAYGIVTNDILYELGETAYCVSKVRAAQRYTGAHQSSDRRLAARHGTDAGSRPAHSS